MLFYTTTMNTTPFRCHDADACAMGQNACPTPSICGCAAPACAVKDGTHKPAEALHQQIAEPQPEALRLADALTIPECTLEHDDCMKAGQLLRAQHTLIADLQSQLDAIGAGGVEPLRKPASQPAALSAARYTALRANEAATHGEAAAVQLDAMCDELAAQAKQGA